MVSAQKYLWMTKRFVSLAALLVLVIAPADTKPVQVSIDAGCAPGNITVPPFSVNIYSYAIQ